MSQEVDDPLQSLDEITRRMAVDVADTKECVARIEEKMATKADMLRIIRAIDSLAGKLETYSRETAAIRAALDSRGKILREHDRRLQKLESDRA